MAYSPTMGRWVLQEPNGAEYVDGLNLYTAMANNPVNMLDPSGWKATTQSATQPTTQPADQIDERSKKVIAGLYSKLQPLATQAIIIANKKLKGKCKLVAISGIRNLEDQNAIPDANTKAKGKKAMLSYHVWGLAFDIGVFDLKGNYLPNDTKSLKLIAPEIKALGLEWGGDWKKFKDYPHFQYPISNFGMKNISELVKAYNKDQANQNSNLKGLTPLQYIEKRFGGTK